MLTVAGAQVPAGKDRNREAGRGGKPVSLLGQAMPLQALEGVDGQEWRGRHACLSAIPLSARGEGVLQRDAG